MILIVGLGNPGKKYKKTRHNVGFQVIDILKSFDFAQDKNIILLKPQTYMNQSGKAVKSLIAKYKIPTTNIWVVHDDIDLPLGTIRVGQDASSAGHKGIQSIIDELGSKNFVRIRIGIRQQAADPEVHLPQSAGLQPGASGERDYGARRFVLEKFTKDEKKIVKQVIKKAVEIIKQSLKQGPKKTTITVTK